MTSSDAPQGLLHAVLLDGKGSARELSWPEVSAWNAEQGCLWLHFDFSMPGVAEWLHAQSGLNDIAVEALLSEETRPRAQHRGQNLLLALRGINHNPGADPEDMVSLRLWTDGSRLISTRRRRLLSVQDVLEDFRSGHGPRNGAELLAMWIDKLIDRMSDTVDQLEDDVAALEEKVLGDDTNGVRTELSVLRKQTISLRRYLAPQREALNRLTAEQLPWLDEMNHLRLRETADRQIRHIEDIDEVRERAAVAQEELVNRVSEQINGRMYVLSIVTAVFLPLGFFTGLMGINVGGMPGVDSDTAFWVVVAMSASIIAVLALIFRFKKWF